MIGLFIPGWAPGLWCVRGFERADLAHDLERGCAGAAADDSRDKKQLRRNVSTIQTSHSPTNRLRTTAILTSLRLRVQTQRVSGLAKEILRSIKSKSGPARRDCDLRMRIG